MNGRRFLRAAFGAVVVGAAPGLPLVAQNPWKASYFPYPIASRTDGAMLVLHYQDARAAPYFAADGETPNRLNFDGIFSVEAGASFAGSRFVTTRFAGPGLLPGWRFAAQAGIVREGRFEYHGLVDTFCGIPEGCPGLSGYDDRVHRTRILGRADVTRTLVKPLSLALGVGVTGAHFTRFTGPSFFQSDFGDVKNETYGTGRLAVVLDTRDKEANPSKGVLIEGGVYLGVGDSSFTGGYFSARGYVSPRAGTVIAARVLGRAMERAAPLDARYTVPLWEADLSVLGGAESHRAFARGRFTGRGVLLGGLELRHDLLNAGDFGGITLFGFVDAGRAFEDASFRLTTHDLQVGGGGGVALRILRTALFAFNFAGGPDGFNFSMGTGWTF